VAATEEGGYGKAKFAFLANDDFFNVREDAFGNYTRVIHLA
jgi:hypothetical protein